MCRAPWPCRPVLPIRITRRALQIEIGACRGSRNPQYFLHDYFKLTLILIHRDAMAESLPRRNLSKKITTLAFLFFLIKGILWLVAGAAVTLAAR